MNQWSPQMSNSPDSITGYRVTAAANGILLSQIRKRHGYLSYVKPTMHPLEPGEILWTVSTPRGSYSASSERNALILALAEAVPPIPTTTEET